MSKPSILYFVCTSIILTVLTISGYPLILIHKSCIREYIITPYYLAQLGLFVFYGILLGFCDRFIYEVKKNGPWKLDVSKILLFGIPVGLFACSPLIYHGVNVTGLTSSVITYIVNTDAGQIVAAQMILGYVLITSFYKK